MYSAAQSLTVNVLFLDAILLHVLRLVRHEACKFGENAFLYFKPVIVSSLLLSSPRDV